MAIIKAFKGVRPKTDIASQVASRPYDVMNVPEAKAEVENHPYSFLRVTRSEVEMPDGIDVHDRSVYEKAAQKYLDFKKEQILIQDPTECLYAYRQIMDGRAQVGLLCLSSIEDYKNNIVKKHEFTRPEKELDRTMHIKITGAQTGKVLMTYKGVAEINTIIEQVTAENPAYDFKSEDGVQHTLWVISDTQKIANIVQLFADKVPATYIADGHHRVASAFNASQELAAENPNHIGSESYNYFISVIVPAEQMAIIDYNRVVKDLNGLPKTEFLDALSHKFDVQESSATPVKPSVLHEFGLYIDHTWYRLTSKPNTYTEDPLGILDANILQKNVLSEILAIHDPRTDNRVDFVGGIRGLEGLTKRVDSGEMQAAFALYPVSLQQLIDISDAGHVMPPKSTWFEPKLRDGLVVHEIR